jgi:Skp family chaperone for outer membrane proteins
VKKSLFSATLLVLLAGSTCVLAPLHAASPMGPASPDQPHRIGLIDMARVFKEYTKFNALREELKGDLTKSEEQYKQYVTQLQKLNTDLKTYKEGTEEYSRCEKKILSVTTQAETYRKSAQRDLVRREAQVYKTIYLEVADAVAKYADYKKFTLVLRFSADELQSQENAEEVMRGLNKQVVYYRPNDDITSTIVKYLNREYEKTASRPSN